MSDRIHDCLDGRIPLTELDDGELQKLREMEAAVREGLSHIHEASAPDVTDPVMTRVRAAAAERARETTASDRAQAGDGGGWLKRAAEWAWMPRTIQLRPAWALAGIAVVALGVSMLGSPGTGEVTMAGPRPEAGAEVPDAVLYVRFDLDASGASSVRLAGSFNDWQPTVELSEVTPGHWTALVPLRPGVHDYAFVVDGQRWLADPDAIPVRDGFGGVNSRIALLSPEA